MKNKVPINSIIEGIFVESCLSFVKSFNSKKQFIMGKGRNDRQQFLKRGQHPNQKTRKEKDEENRQKDMLNVIQQRAEQFVEQRSRIKSQKMIENDAKFAANSFFKKEALENVQYSIAGRRDWTTYDASIIYDAQPTFVREALKYPEYVAFNAMFSKHAIVLIAYIRELTEFVRDGGSLDDDDCPQIDVHALTGWNPPEKSLKALKRNKEFAENPLLIVNGVICFLTEYRGEIPPGWEPAVEFKNESEYVQIAFQQLYPQWCAVKENWAKLCWLMDLTDGEVKEMLILLENIDVDAAVPILFREDEEPIHRESSCSFEYKPTEFPELSTRPGVAC